MFVLIGLSLPVFGYASALYIFRWDLIVVALFGACGFSAGAFVLWLRSQYLASQFLMERQMRAAARLRAVAAASAVEGKEMPQRTPKVEEGGMGEGATACVGPRTVARIDPVLPAALSVVSLLLAAGNILLAVAVLLHEMIATP